MLFPLVGHAVYLIRKR
ncbi:MAG TPA: hypothetical protein DCS89_07430 [Gammaproteobacteria bacterium]|nr:hypothetical protein [Gammaproteobacteria bacterium]HIF86720.1 hypothetical protein [Gammaproteobacteria bacterium]HIL62931.1 hypothetical protein [Porticoccaceae bacterium]HIN91099.1 hypothetical protein [Porticoccaceae bacterium]